MLESVRVGVVGTSWFADGFHLPNLASHPRVEIAAICGRTRERAAELAAKYAVPRVFTDYRAMIASGALDALVVVTPDVLHHPITPTSNKSSTYLSGKGLPIACSSMPSLRTALWIQPSTMAGRCNK
jgi:predicted short-subunit dehydrogenase-like oxidoreductase (DUF2520 family)